MAPVAGSEVAAGLILQANPNGGGTPKKENKIKNLLDYMVN